MFAEISHSRLNMMRYCATTTNLAASFVNHQPIYFPSSSIAQCTLQYLRMAFATEKQVCEILLRAFDLETLVLGTRKEYLFHSSNDAAEISFVPHQRLTSLTISGRSESIDTSLSFLSLTPCLRHLKVINIDVDLLDGPRWEEFIKSKLPTLKKFEFYTSCSSYQSEKETDESTLHRLISPFCMPFWTKEKRWSVRCNRFLTRKIVEIYTTPICISDYIHPADPNTQTVFNFATEERQSTISTSVYQLRIALCRPKLNEHRVS